MGVDLAATCREYEAKLVAGTGAEPGLESSYRQFEVRAYRVESGNPFVGGPVDDRLPACACLSSVFGGARRYSRPTARRCWERTT